MAESVLRSETPKVFEGRFPRLDEVLLYGGRPGVQYCYVDGSNMGKFQELGFELIRDTEVIKIIGPKGECSSVVVMGKGKPIPGADPRNGIRVLGVDWDIQRATGLDEPGVEVQDGQEEEGDPEAPPPEAA